jgi:polyisoprenyl-phosphate glycosyltransferase
MRNEEPGVPRSRVAASEPPSLAPAARPEPPRPPPRIAVGAPFYNEEETAAAFLSRTLDVLTLIPGGPHQIVCVNDGSSDGTGTILKEAAAADSRITVVELSRNFGHQAALTAALDFVEGDVCVLMDSDLQDPPEAIPRFVERYREGYDVVYARRASRKEPWWLKVSYWTYYRVLGYLAGILIPVDSGDFSLLSQRVVLELRAAPERHRFLRGLRAWVGFRQIAVDVHRERRYAGKTKYSPSRLFRLAFDGIFSFSVAPLRAASALGAFTILVSSGYALYALVVRLLLGQPPRGFTALILMFTFMSGVMLFFMGLIGEYIGRIYEEVKRRPMYVVREVTSVSERDIEQ